MGLALMLAALSSCSDDKTTTAGTDTPVPVQQADYNYSVRMGDGVSQRVMVVDGITGDVSDITTSAAWLTARQDGQDGEQHPVLLLTIDGENNEERTAYVRFLSQDNKQVSIAVKQQPILGSNSEEDRLPEVTSCNKAFYEDWYEGANGKVYITETANKNTWRKQALPWADNAMGTVPAYVDEDMRNNKKNWRLVYSTLGLETACGANFFALFNSSQGRLRFFYYVPATYITTATSACFTLEVYNPSSKLSFALNSNEPLEMPDNLQKSGKVTLANGYDSSGSSQTLYVVPIGTGSSRCITSGWTCFDVLVDHGYTDTAKEALEDPRTRMTLRLNTTLEGSINMLADLRTTGDIDMSGVSLTKKGSSLQAAATFFNGFGSSLFQIGTGVTNIIDGEKAAGGVVQVIGGCSSLVGTCLNTAAAAQDSKQTFSGSATTNLSTKGSINGKITFNTINSVPAITFRPSAFKYKWETLLSDHPQKWTQDSSLPTYGLVNLIDNPVVYVSADHALYSPAKYPAHYEADYKGQLIHCDTNDDEQLRYISFLDPTTVEVFLNKEMMGYNFESADVSISLFVNAGSKEQYTGPSPYVEFYQLKNDGIQLTTHDGSDSFDNIFSKDDTKSMKLVECANADIPTIKKADDPQFDAHYVVSQLVCNDKSTDTFEKGFNYRYYGLTGSMFNGNMKIVVDPVIYVPTDVNHTFLYNKSNLGPLYLSVCLRLTKSDKSVEIITKHFKPEVRAFKVSDINSIKTRIGNYNPSTIKTNRGTTTANFTDTEWLKQRAFKMLELAGK